MFAAIGGITTETGGIIGKVGGINLETGGITGKTGGIKPKVGGMPLVRRPPSDRVPVKSPEKLEKCAERSQVYQTCIQFRAEKGSNRVYFRRRNP